MMQNGIYFRQNLIEIYFTPLVFSIWCLFLFMEEAMKGKVAST